MLSYPPNVSVILISCLDAEISRQEAIGAMCGDDWPDGYDPNDAVMYRSFREWLHSHDGHAAIIEDAPCSKSVRFVMALVPGFVHENISRLSPADIESVYSVFSKYVAMRCLKMLETHGESGTERQQVMHLLDQIIAFPVP